MKRIFNVNNYLPFVNGLLGDKLAEQNDPWAITMSFRKNGKDVAVSDLERSVQPENVLIFVHGLMADERVWKHFPALEKNLSVYYVRYNSGLHIFENGRLLAKLLKAFSERVRIGNLYLAGHSMGGLVIRSASHYASRNRHRWVEKVASIFLIAVPHKGAALEKMGHMTSLVLNQVGRWHFGTVGAALDYRSNGIQDLRLGTPVERPLTPSHPLSKIQYHILVGSLSANANSRLAKYFGDGLVTQSSAVGSNIFQGSKVKIFPKTGHNSILRHPSVHRYVRRVLKESR